MILLDLCPIINKENGFYITDEKGKSGFNTKFYQDSDDFYEQPYAKYEMNRTVDWIETKNNRLNIFIK